jgi:NAD(P)-dependent dehydrogenase (short-subunit alcohol dehydrogenase family)
VNLTGKTVIITAGAGGIGLAIARRFAELGAELCLCDISEPALEQARAEFPNAMILRVNVARSDDVAQFYSAFSTRFSRLDALINNAGISGPTKPIEDVSDDEWQATLDVNITGMFHMVRGAVPFLRAAGGGSVVNMSSVAGRLGMPLRVPYSVSKYAVRGLTDALAVELGEFGTRVNTLMPGLVDGPRGARIVAEQAAARGISAQVYEQMMLHNISMHSKVQMAEIADMAAFLVSDLAPHISGQSIGVCGNFENYRAPLLSLPQE